MKISYDLFNSGFKESVKDVGGLTSSAIIGYLESWCAPLTLKRVCNDLDVAVNRNRISTYSLASLGVETLVYTAFMGHHIEDLLTDPSDVKNWIPLATNVAGRTIGYLYNHYSEIADSLKEEDNLHVARVEVSEKPEDSEPKSGESRYYD